MNHAPKRVQQDSKPPAIQRVAKGLYIALFVLSLIVVVSFVALKVFAPAPTVDSQVTFAPPSVPVESARPVKASKSPDDSDDADDEPEPIVLNRRDGVYTCLLLGVADQGGSDTIMLGVFDTGAKTASLISIPRDTVVLYNGKYRKINALYSTKGGVAATSAAVAEMLAVPIDYYVSVNTKAFREIVNQIGGVYFNVPVDMDYEDPYQDLVIHIKKGYQKLDGKQAEGVVRCRSCYASADIGRAATQRAFLTALVKQTVTVSNVDKVTSLINIFSSYVKSTMSVNDMVFFATQAIGMDLDTALTAGGLPGEWTNPYGELDDAATLELVNSLNIYEEEIPAEVLHIIHP